MKRLFKQYAQLGRVVDVGPISPWASLRDRLIIHPFLLALSPLLFLYGNNYESVPLKHLAKSMLLVALITGALFVILSRLWGNRAKAGMLVSALSLLFFNYGGVHEYLFIRVNYEVGQHHYLLVVWAGLFLILAGVISKKGESGRTLTRFLNLFSALWALTLTAVILFATYNYNRISDNLFELSGPDLEEINRPSDGQGSRPDIYYIILDGYASSATLSSVYGYPDNDLISFLKEKGFYVAADSAANYSYTCLSISSSLNMSHLLDLSRRMRDFSTFLKPLYEMAEDHAVAKYLKSRGYTYIHYGSRYDLTYKNRLADLNVNCNSEEFDAWLSLLMRTTMLSGLESSLPDGWLNYVKTESQKTLCPFTEADVALRASGPKFVFMHVLLPHPPFVFKRNGETYNEGVFLDFNYPWVKDKYLEQLIFLNGKVKELIDKILSSSPKKPIIILQSDHGPASMLKWDSPDDVGLKERMTILNAYLLPEGGARELYKTITPVNSFRLVFNHYFGARFKLLEDRSYFSTMKNPYAFIDVTDRVSGKLP